MVEEKLGSAPFEIRLAFDVAVQEIAERIVGSRIVNELNDQWGELTSIRISEGIGSILYASKNPLLLVEVPASEGVTMPLAFSMDNTAVIMGEDSVRFVSPIKKEGVSDGRIMSVSVISRRISYEVFLLVDCVDEQVQTAIDFLNRQRGS